MQLIIPVKRINKEYCLPKQYLAIHNHLRTEIFMKRFFHSQEKSDKEISLHFAICSKTKHKHK